MAKSERVKAFLKKKTTVKQEPKKHGNDTFNREIFDDICRLISLGKMISVITAKPGYPPRDTFLEWKNRSEENVRKYARAKNDGYKFLAEETLRIADTPQMGETRITEEIITRSGDSVPKVTIREKEMTAHRRLQIDTRKWLLSKWNPAQYGDKLQHTGDGGGDIKVNVYIPDNGRDNGDNGRDLSDDGDK